MIMKAISLAHRNEEKLGWPFRAFEGATVRFEVEPSVRQLALVSSPGRRLSETKDM
jgi:hypothetical protein